MLLNKWIQGSGLLADQNGHAALKLQRVLPYHRQEQAPRTWRQATGAPEAVRSGRNYREGAKATVLRCTGTVAVSACACQPLCLRGPKATRALGEPEARWLPAERVLLGQLTDSLSSPHLVRGYEDTGTAWVALPG
ncbi:hypothetical protein NDU88_008048 [Pleurodeles waltl]|uniref:Uncharacterized protein n=1 Tax=Pleurodeles waltl TaxID=8319 RepID=A0AAV7RU28_PLEWA|nr:hypothetical protein NDU88_008048 [Pleurodeles waltl]